MVKLAKHSGSKSLRVPTLVVDKIDSEHLAVRFEQIGDRQRFGLILQRFRSEFLLAECQEIDNQKWWVIASSQSDDIAEFCRRNGLRLEKR